MTRFIKKTKTCPFCARKQLLLSTRFMGCLLDSANFQQMYSKYTC